MPQAEKAILDEWRQGDLALMPFELPLLSTEAGEPVIIFANAPGVAMLTQSCDIIRNHVDKPYVQVALLKPANAREFQRIKRGELPRLGIVAAAEALGLVVDFDVTATVDKETVQQWRRSAGCADDSERRIFARALARHRQRFAFPDVFNDVSVKKVRGWLEDKRSSDSAFGRLVRAITEVRVTCDNWNDPGSVTYFLVLDAQPALADEAECQKAIATLEGRAKLNHYPDPSFRIVTLDDLTAREYLESDRLDLDAISGPQPIRR